MKIRSPLLVTISLAALGLGACAAKREVRTNVLTAADRTDQAELVVMDFSRPISLDPIEPGWRHAIFGKFRHVRPMDISFASVDGVPAIGLRTHDSGSILYRYVDVDLEQYPILAWRWYISQPVESDADERSWFGDDHPASLYVKFEASEEGERRVRGMQLVWGNDLRSGRYFVKALGISVMPDIPHYVVRGGDADTGRWYDEQVDLLELYRNNWPRHEDVAITHVGILSDSDNTDSRGACYFADVRLKRKPAGR